VEPMWQGAQFDRLRLADVLDASGAEPAAGADAKMG